MNNKQTQVQEWELNSGSQADVPMSFIRSLIQRGDFEHARILINELLHPGSAQAPSIRSQLGLEKTRIAIFENAWMDALTYAKEAFAGAAPATQIALFQLQALAHFELGLYAEANQDLESSQSMSSLLPYPISLVYSEFFKARVIARARNVKAAEQYLDKLFLQKLNAERADFNLLLTYVRISIDLKRLSKKSTLSESVASFLLADAMGDRLYCSLAEVDYLSNRVNNVNELVDSLSTTSKSFRRVELLLQELSGKGPLSTTGATLKARFENANLPSDELPDLKIPNQSLHEDSFKNFDLVLLKHGVFVELSSSRLVQIPTDNPLLKGLGALAHAPLNKEKFFCLVWDEKAYSPKQHDSLISSLIQRMNKEVGINVRIQNGLIRAEKHIISI